MFNPIMDTDSYKLSHFKQYPPKTTGLRAYFEARTEAEQIRFFGLQYVLKKSMLHRITAEQVDEAETLATQHGLPFPRAGWMRVVEKHGGKLPLLIKAVPEGMAIPSRNVLFTVESTDPELYWLVTWFETVLSRVWYPTTVATRSYGLKNFIADALEQTSDNPETELPFKLHDFGSRGVSSEETAGIGGMAHLLNFMGTDTIAGIMYANEFYGTSEMPGFSIPASEHSTITSWGRDGELDAYRNMLEQFGKPGAIVACVSDSYDIYNAVENLWGEKLRQEVIDSGATLVVRPDSGDPLQMVLYCLETLADKFGYTVNSKGYKVLNTVRVIQGDGVGPEDIKDIITKTISLGYSMDNLAFGMGGGLLQRVDRDTHKFAYKVCEIEIDGAWHPVRKDPVDGGKTSKSGNLDLVRPTPETFATVDRRTFPLERESVLREVYRDGELLADDTFEQVKERA